MSDRAIHVVCFDLGGVIIRICRSWMEGAARAGLPIRDGIAELLDQRQDDRRRLVNEFQTGRLEPDAYFKQVSEMLDGLYTPVEIRGVHDAWMLGDYDGLPEVIDDIHDAGVETACLSNINPVHWAMLQDHSTLGRLRRTFASHLIGHHKPDPAIYDHFEREVGIDGAKILFFDDLIENIEAARARGWRAVHIDHEAPTDRQIRAALHEYSVVVDRDCVSR